MAHVPVLDQGTTRLCTTYVAAEMIDAWRFSHGDRQFDLQTSPFSTGLLAKAPHSQIDLNNLDFDIETCSVVNSARQIGACTRNNTFEGSGFFDITDSVNLATQPFADAMMRESDFESIFGGPSDEILEQDSNDALCAIRNMNIPSGLIPSIQAIKTAIKSGSSRDYLKTIFASRCKSQNLLKLKSPPCHPSSIFSTHGSRMAKINELLSQPNPQPVGIYYCSSILLQGANYQNAPCLYHASTIIGRREKNGVCQMKIRNSQGTSCALYSPDWECDGEGNIWVDADVLKGDINEISYIE